MSNEKNIQAFIIDAEQIFGEAETLTASGVVGAYVDLKGKGLAYGNVVIDVSAIDTGDADETYDVVVELGTDDANYVEAISFPVTATGRVVRSLNNQASAMYNSVRVSLVIAGTTPSITLSAFLCDELPKPRS